MEKYAILELYEIIMNSEINFNFSFLLKLTYSQHGASDSVTDISVLSNLTDAENAFCLGLCGRYICCA